MATKKATAARLTQVGLLNQQSIEELTERLRDNPALKREAIKSIRSNLYAFLDKVFELTKAQRLALQTAIPKELEVAIAETCILALNNPGVRIIKTQTDGSPQVTLNLSLTAIAPSLREQLKAAKKAANESAQDAPTVEGEGTIKTRC